MGFRWEHIVRTTIGYGSVSKNIDTQVLLFLLFST